jgi:hypothetical protein
MPELINTRMMKNPFNWIILYLMVLFGAYAVHVLFGMAAPKTVAED